MTEIPKIAQHRLATKPSSAHPDANLLAAFVDQTLRPAERESLIVHLSACAGCRDIVALSTPETENLSPAIKPTGWLAWPTLRWAAAAACVVVVGAAVTLHFQSQPPARETATTSASGDYLPAQKDMSAALKSEPENQPQLKAQVPARDLEARAEKRSSLSPQDDKKNAMNSRAFEFDGARRQMQPPSSMAAAPAPVASAENEVASRMEEQTSRDQRRPAAVPAVPQISPLRDDKPAVAADELAAAGKAKDADENKIRAKQEMQRGAFSGAVGTLAKSQASVAQTYKLDAASRRWRVSPEGAVQLSTDSGSTWQTLPVDGNPVFRAVTGIGNEVWAGGEAGALYHSADSGQHWARITLIDDGKALTSDITAITFINTQFGQFSTADGQPWSTSDAGQTWHKQPLPK
jgi:hypothetical protein